MNPLFSDSDDDSAAKKPDGYVLRRGPEPDLQPVSGKRHESDDTPNPAADLIRRKLDALYADEPNAGLELGEVQAEKPAARSKHQEFMHNLSTSGKSLAQIQTEWHEYYASLPDDQKHEVWQEFYAANARQNSAISEVVAAQKQKTIPKIVSHHKPETPAELPMISPSEPEKPGVVVVDHTPKSAVEADEKPDKKSSKTAAPKKSRAPVPGKDGRSMADLKKQVTKKVLNRSRAQLKAKQHLQSLAFGLGIGALTLLVVLFSFFNEIIITPFIQPSRKAGPTPIILSTDGPAPSATPEVIIPKTNVQIPVDYNETSIDDAAVEKSLESGILHYPTTVHPGEQGNTAFFGHSSNNIFNKGKYKFAFVLLHELVPGDIFYLTYNSKVYAYKVYDKKIVAPNEVTVLNNVPDKTATATLITCDPPGTSLHRLVVWGEQISPDPTGNGASTAALASAQAPSKLADNGPTLWKRITSWVGGLF